MSDMTVVLQQRGTAYPWRAHGLYELRGSCLTRNINKTSAVLQTTEGKDQRFYVEISANITIRKYI
jgi:hypothetical protein